MLWILALIALWMQLQRTYAIVQGMPDTGNTYSKVCTLVAVDGGGYDVMCSAVLISPSILLSAAHCAGKRLSATLQWAPSMRSALCDALLTVTAVCTGAGSGWTCGILMRQGLPSST